MVIEPIGRLRSCFGSKFGVPRQPGLCPSAWGYLELEGEYGNPDCVRGLELFSHVWLVFGFHETVAQGWRPTVRPPRLGGNERVGVFASRSTFRPNGLGLSLVKLNEVATLGDGGGRGVCLWFSGVDLVDGTPVYDIKPYLPYAESVAEASDGFAGGELARFRVVIGDGLEDQFEKMPERDYAVIREVLSFDVRPAGGSGGEGRVYGALLCGRDVRFRYEGEACVVVGISGGLPAK